MGHYTSNYLQNGQLLFDGERCCISSRAVLTELSLGNGDLVWDSMGKFTEPQMPEESQTSVLSIR